MKIAILLRGQARQFHQSAELFRHFTENRHPSIDFEHHIYAWNSLTNSSSGCPAYQTQSNSIELLSALKQNYNPHSISVADERVHYDDVICPWTTHYKTANNIGSNTEWDSDYDSKYNSVRDHWVLNQIIADMRVQSQAYNYYKDRNKPDLIVDTRTEMMHWFNDDVLEAYSNVADNTILTARSSVNPQGYREVDDYTFVYNWNTLRHMCKHTPDVRLYNSLYSNIQTHMDLKLKHDDWGSHKLYPVIVHTDCEYQLMQRNLDFSETVLTVRDETLLKHTLNSSATNDAYNEYSMIQNDSVISGYDVATMGLREHLYSIHNELTLTGRHLI